MFREVLLGWSIIWGSFAALILLVSGDTSMLNVLVWTLGVVGIIYGWKTIFRKEHE